MKIDHKLKLNSAVVLALLTVSVAVAVFFFDRIEKDVRQLAEVEEPLKQAIQEMEINVGETARAVFDYIRDPHQLDFDRIQDSESDFERFAGEFERLAETEAERALGQQVAVLFREFKILGDEITAMSKRRFDDLAVFRKDVEAINALIDEKLQPAIDRSAADALTKLEAALDMGFNIGEVFSAIEGYALRSDPQLRQKIADSETDFERFEAQYRGTRVSADEKRWLDVIDRAFHEAVTTGNGIIALTDELRKKWETFEEDLEEIEGILDDEVQILILDETRRVATDARQSGENTITIMIVIGLGVFACMAGVNFLVSKGIVDAVNRLSEGAMEFGRGNLDHRIETLTKDEIGTLAGSFNQMAELLQSTTVSRDYVDSILESVTDGIITLDAKGLIATYNSAVERIFGYQGEELIGQNVSILLPEDESMKLETYTANSKLHAPRIISQHRELEGCRKDGSLFSMDLVVAPMKIEGGRGFVCTMRDITERKIIEDHLEKRSDELKRVNAELERFVYVASHDLKAPMRGIDNLVTWIEQDLEGKFDDETQENLTLLRGRVHRMEDLLDGLLEYSRIGHTATKAEAVDTRELVADIVDFLALPNGFTVEMPDPMPVLTTEKVSLEQVFRNLIGNAVKHHDRDEGRITVSASNNGEWCEFSVSDDGPGIPPEFHERVFTMFQTLKSRDEVEGSGMGLALVKKEVELHSGTILIDSDAGTRGTSFRFTWKGNSDAREKS